MTKNEVVVQGLNVRYNKINEEDYISLTDIAKAKNPEHTGGVINNWLRNNTTLRYLGLWETLHNPDFNVIEFEHIKNLAENCFLNHIII